MVLWQSSTAFVKWAPERPILGNPKQHPGVFTEAPPAGKPSGTKGLHNLPPHRCLDSLAEAPEMSNSQQLLINWLYFVLSSSSYRSAADKTLSDLDMADLMFIQSCCGSFLWKQQPLWIKLFVTISISTRLVVKEGHEVISLHGNVTI